MVKKAERRTVHNVSACQAVRSNYKQYTYQGTVHQLIGLRMPQACKFKAVQPQQIDRHPVLARPTVAAVCAQAHPHRNTDPETDQKPTENHRRTNENKPTRQKLKDPGPA